MGVLPRYLVDVAHAMLDHHPRHLPHHVVDSLALPGVGSTVSECYPLHLNHHVETGHTILKHERIGQSG
jgi:hypothetical protein